MKAQHGTYKRYLEGCTEECCYKMARSVHAARALLTTHQSVILRARKEGMREFAGLKHGTCRTYNEGCRCSECVTVNAAYRRSRWSTRKAQTVGKKSTSSSPSKAQRKPTTVTPKSRVAEGGGFAVAPSLRSERQESS